jgi:type IV secretion system protein VirB10
MSDRPADREITAVAPRRPTLFSGRVRQAALGVVGLGAVGLIGMGVYSGMHDDGPPTKPVDTGSTTIAQTVASPPEPTAAKPPPPPPAKDPEPSRTPFQAAAAVPQFVILPANGGGSFDVPPIAKPDRAAAQGTGAGADPSTARDAATTHVAFAPAVVAGGRAGPAIHLTYVMMPQTIPCALDTAMDSTLAGPILCHTTQDVLSPAHITLLPAGTTIVGSYKNDVRNGQHRLFALTGNAITQDGIPVPLNSPVADGLGRTGIEGDYDGHVGEKFGAAIALTAFQSATQLAQADLTRGNQNNTNFNFSGGGSSGGIESLALEILRQQGGIPPTISVPPGSIVSIVIDHPIDFSDALHVEARR